MKYCIMTPLRELIMLVFLFLLSLDLKEFSEGVVTTEIGREFHKSTTQFEKKHWISF